MGSGLRVHCTRLGFNPTTMTTTAAAAAVVAAAAHGAGRDQGRSLTSRGWPGAAQTTTEKHSRATQREEKERE